jgi:hypothetical protein
MPLAFWAICMECHGARPFSHEGLTAGVARARIGGRSTGKARALQARPLISIVKLEKKKLINIKSPAVHNQVESIAFGVLIVS